MLRLGGHPNAPYGGSIKMVPEKRIAKPARIPMVKILPFGRAMVSLVVLPPLPRKENHNH